MNIFPGAAKQMVQGIFNDKPWGFLENHNKEIGY